MDTISKDDLKVKFKLYQMIFVKHIFLCTCVCVQCVWVSVFFIVLYFKDNFLLQVTLFDAARCSFEIKRQ